MRIVMHRIVPLIFLTWFTCNAFSQVPGKEELLNHVFGKDGEIYFSFEANSRQEVVSLSRIISIDNVTDALKVYAYANRDEFSRYLDQGIPYQILSHPGDYDGPLNMKDALNIREIKDWDFYPTYEGYVAMMYQFADDYPDLCQVFSIRTTNQGRELLVAHISDNIGFSENEPEFLYTSSMHGDETTGYGLMLHLIDYLLSNYGTDPKVTNIVDNVDIYINPLANPDGTYAGGNNTVNGATRYNALNVDLNRNYPDPEAGPHPDGNAWQVETVAFMDFAEDRDLVSSANIHGGSEVCNYPWDTWQNFCADNDWWVYVCREYADTAHQYSPAGYLTDLDNGITNGYAWYTITGGRQDYMNYFQQCREFTLEISSIKLLPPSQLPAFWEYNYRSLLNYMEQCQYGIRGTVKDSSNGWPIEAEVYVLLHEEDSSWVYSSLPNGNYHRLLAEGTYSVRYSAEGYESKVVSGLTVINRQATVVDVLLDPNTGVGGLDNNSIDPCVEFYPNPLKGSRINLNSSFYIKDVTIFDLAGKALSRILIEDTKASLDLSDLGNGIYIFQVNTQKGICTKKLVINQ